ncbi:hypothetical protein BU17DRAFT_62707 [Hysterangium stoloniferum]|nr:hypothetical protein BU17DRAFT_62707 [Hysterangium stoloniferum]
MSRETDDTKKRPIIFIAHSLGGIILKSQQISDFNAITAHFHMKFFYETLATTLPGHISTIVPRSSAVVPGAVNIEPIGMHKDHTGLSKFGSVNDDDFKSVLCAIQDMVKKAPAAVHVRWIKFNDQSAENTPNGSIYIPKLCPSPNFVGQKKYLIRLRKFFAPENCLNSLPAWKRFLLYGMGGVGKTQICLQFIEELLRNDYTHRKVLSNFWRIFWIDGTNTETLTNGFSSIADDPEAKSKGIEKSPEEVVRWLTAVQKRCLIIYDNADGMDEVVKEYWQQMRQIHVLITSRNPGLASHVTESMHVTPMESDEAIVLFQAAAKCDNKADVTIQKLSEKIVTKLGFLPLALDIAGAAISTGLCRMSEYLIMLGKYQRDFLDADNPSMKGALGYNHTVYSTLKVSYDLIEKQAMSSTRAQNALFILKVLGFFHHQNIMESIFKRAAEFPPANTYDGRLKTTASDLPAQLLRCNGDEEWESLSFRLAMQVLCDYSFLSRDPGTKCLCSWTMHPVIHMWIRDEALGINCIPHYYAARALIVGSINESNKMNDILFQRDILPHIIANQSVTSGKKKDYYDDMSKRFALVYKLAGKYSDTEVLEIEVIESRQKILGTEHPDTLSAKANLAVTYYWLGRLTDAEKLGVQVLKDREQHLGTEHPDTLGTKGNLAVTYRQLGRWTDAEQLEVQVLKAREQLLGTEHLYTLSAKANLAVTYHELGRWTDAEQLQVQVLKASEQLLGTEHLYTLSAKANLAVTYCRLGRWTDAEQLEVQVLKASEQLQGTEHPYTLSAKANLAATYHELGRWTDAEQLQVQVLKASEQLLGTEHPNTLSARAALAATYDQLGRWIDAEKLGVQVLKDSEQLLGTEHPDTLSAKANLAVTYAWLGRWTDAEQLQVQVLKVREQVLGTEHPDTLTSRANLAVTYCQLGRRTDAEQLQVQVLKAREQFLGTEHPDTLSDKESLAVIYCQLGRLTDAEQLNVQVLKAREQLLGTEHPDTLTSRANLAIIYCQLGRWTDGEQLEVQVLKAKEQHLGTEHPDTLRAMDNLALTYSQLGRWTDAEQLEVQVLKAREQLLGTEHPVTLKARANLAIIYRQLGRWIDVEQLEVQVLKAREQHLGTEHPDTLRAMANLGLTYYQLGRWTDAVQLQVLEASQSSYTAANILKT